MKKIRMGQKARKMTDDHPTLFFNHLRLEDRGLCPFNPFALLLLLLTGTPLLTVSWPLSYWVQAAEIQNDAAQTLDLCREKLKKEEFEAAIQVCQTAVDAFKKEGDRSGEVASTLNLGIAYDKAGQNRQALKILETGLLLAQQINDRRLEAFIQQYLGNIYNTLGQSEKAQVFQEKAKSYFDQQRTADQLFQQGHEKFGQQQFSEALQRWQDALAIFQAIGDRQNEALLMGMVGTAYHALGEYPKAIDFHQQSLAIARKINNRLGEAQSLGSLGDVYSRLGEYSKAIDSYQKSLAFFRDIDNRPGKVRMLGKLGEIYFRLGQYEKVIGFYQQLIMLSRETRNQLGESQALVYLGNAHSRLGEYPQAIDSYQKSLSISKEIENHRGKAQTLGSLGNAYFNLGEYSKAIDSHQQALAIARRIRYRLGEAQSLGGLGNIYFRLGEYSKAIDLHQQSLLIKQNFNDQVGAVTSLGNLGIAYSRLGDDQKAIEFYQQALTISRKIEHIVGETQALGNLGISYSKLDNYQESIKFHQRSLTMSQDIGDPLGEANALGGLGRNYDSLGDHQKAIALYQESLLLAQSINAQESEGYFLNNLGLTFAKKNNPELAIVFLKQSINRREQIRKKLKGLPQATQQSYTDTVENSYRSLATLLLQQDRILEAQAVLDLLKVQELDDYFRGVRGNGAQLDYLKPELEILTRYQESQKSAIQLIQELDTLTQLAKTGDITSAQTQRRKKLISLRGDLKGQLNDFLRQPEIQILLAQLSQESGRESLNLTQLTALQDNLANVNGVLLSPLILDDRLELVLTPPKGKGTPLRRTVPVKRTDLNQAILDLRLALENPKVDPKPAAQQLYNWLIKPLESDLTQSEIETILYAPDGQLRYIPLAALHDGNQWLIERYPVSNFTTTSSTDFDTQPQLNPKILAGAFADQAVTRTVSTATRNLDFQGLPFAGVEVKKLAQSRPDTTALIDNEFNLNRTLEEIDLHQIIHFATHAAFVPSNPESSFIVFGEGKNPNLLDIQNWDLSHVDLVVLSACETAVGGILGSGVEVLGLGYQFQTSGTKAVMASLWQVNDGSTQTLMNAFYEGLNAKTTKSEALRQAQLALITGDYRKVGGKRASVELKTAEKNETDTSPESFAHPYYWAPFILIGNGR